jgi:hypothetical protein
MWVRVHHCDDEKKLVFGMLDNEPVNNHDGKIKLGAKLPLAILKSGSTGRLPSSRSSDSACSSVAMPRRSAAECLPSSQNGRTS